MVLELSRILSFSGQALLELWPYLALTIPLAVAVNMSGASRHITRVFEGRPAIAILLATLVGAFSPFCSCGVIPVVASLLLAGVPLAPVMSFWVASPSMDPEAFFLSVGTLGWRLAFWRLGATLALSLAAGFITYFATRSGWLRGPILRPRRPAPRWSVRQWLGRQGFGVREALTPRPAVALVPAAPGGGSPGAAVAGPEAMTLRVASAEPAPSCSCASQPDDAPGPEAHGFWQRCARESWGASLMVARFMALAILLGALLHFYVPSDLIVALVGGEPAFAVVMAALVGVPAYTSNLAALPLVKGLLSQGMDPAAALAFLIAGPTTTIPAMAAVWGIVTRRVFALYVSLSLVGAVALGWLYAAVDAL